MLNLIKYEYKKTKTVFISLLVGTIIASMMLLGAVSPRTFWGAIYLIPFSVILIAIFIYGLTIYLGNSFKKDLDEDSGYLTFALPVSSKEMIISRLVLHSIYSIILQGVILLTFFVFLKNIDTGGFEAIKTEIKQVLGMSSSTFLVLSVFLSVILQYLVVYFSITIGKVIVNSRNNKLKESRVGSWWIVIYLIISGIHNKLIGLISNNMDVETLINNNVNIKMVSMLENIFLVISIIGFFFLTSYLIEKKVEIK